MVKVLNRIPSVLILSIIIALMTVNVFTINSYAEEITEIQNLNTLDNITSTETVKPNIIQEIIGPFNTWSGDGNMSLTLEINYFNIEFGGFEKLLYSDEEFDSSNYTVIETDGSIIITFKEEYLKTLINGVYYFDADFLNATISPAFRFDVDINDIQSTTATTTNLILDGSPKTSDDTPLGTYFVLLLLSTVTALALVIGRRRNNKEI